MSGLILLRALAYTIGFCGLASLVWLGALLCCFVRSDELAAIHRMAARVKHFTILGLYLTQKIARKTALNCVAYLSFGIQAVAVVAKVPPHFEQVIR
jgi:hypothetical protein